MIKVFKCRLILTRSGLRENVFLEVKDDIVSAIYTDKSNLEIIDKYYELDGMVLPSLVNGHTHLELGSSIDSDESKKELWDWILDTIKYKKSLSSDAFKNNLVQEEMLLYKSGVSVAGDVRSVLPEGSFFNFMRGIIFFEVLGYTEDLFQQKLDAFQSFLDSSKNYTNFTPGISIHSLYTTPFSKAREVVRFARSKRLPIMIHLAETEFEDDLFFKNDVTGFKKIFNNINFEQLNFSSYADIIDFLELGDDTFIVHCVNLGEKDWQKVEERGITAVFCPNSNMFWKNKLPNFDYVVSTNVNFMLGTDSERTNKVFDILEDAKLMYKNIKDKNALSKIIDAITYKGRDLFKLKGVGIEVGDVCSFLFFPIKCDSKNALESVLTEDVAPIVYQKEFKNEALSFFEKQH